MSLSILMSLQSSRLAYPTVPHGFLESTPNCQSQKSVSQSTQLLRPKSRRHSEHSLFIDIKSSSLSRGQSPEPAPGPPHRLPVAQATAIHCPCLRSTNRCVFPSLQCGLLSDLLLVSQCDGSEDVTLETRS